MRRAYILAASTLAAACHTSPTPPLGEARPVVRASVGEARPVDRISVGEARPAEGAWYCGRPPFVFSPTVCAHSLAECQRRFSDGLDGGVDDVPGPWPCEQKATAPWCFEPLPYGCVVGPAQCFDRKAQCEEAARADAKPNRVPARCEPYHE